MSNTTVLTEWFRHVPEDKWLRDPAACRADAKFIWDKLELKAGVKVLECPCGKADLGFPLARLGAIVSGIDFNSHFIIGAKNKFQRAALEGSFKTADMRTCDLPTDMDVVINWGSSFGYFSDEGNSDLLQRFAGALNHGGRLLIEVANPDLVVAGKATRIIEINRPENKIRFVHQKLDNASNVKSAPDRLTGSLNKTFSGSQIVLDADADIVSSNRCSCNLTVSVKGPGCDVTKTKSLNDGGEGSVSVRASCKGDIGEYQWTMERTMNGSGCECSWNDVKVDGYEG